MKGLTNILFIILQWRKKSCMLKVQILELDMYASVTKYSNFWL